MKAFIKKVILTDRSAVYDVELGENGSIVIPLNAKCLMEALKFTEGLDNLLLDYTNDRLQTFSNC